MWPAGIGDVASGDVTLEDGPLAPGGIDWGREGGLDSGVST